KPNASNDTINPANTAVTGAPASRNSYVGIATPYGALKLGKNDTSYKTVTADFDFLADTPGDYNSIMGNTGGDNRTEFDARFPHAVWYDGVRHLREDMAQRRRRLQRAAARRLLRIRPAEAGTRRRRDGRLGARCQHPRRSGGRPGRQHRRHACRRPPALVQPEDDDHRELCAHAEQRRRTLRFGARGTRRDVGLQGRRHSDDGEPWPRDRPDRERDHLLHRHEPTGVFAGHDVRLLTAGHYAREPRP